MAKWIGETNTTSIEIRTFFAIEMVEELKARLTRV